MELLYIVRYGDFERQCRCTPASEPGRKNLVELRISEIVVRPSYENHDGKRPELEAEKDPTGHHGPLTWCKISMLEYYMKRHGVILEDLGLLAVKAWHNG